MNRISFLPLLFLLISSQLVRAQVKDDRIAQTMEADRLLVSWQFEKALTIIDALSRQYPEDGAIKERLGYCYYRSGDYNKAEIIFKEILEKDSLNTQALNQLAQISFKQGNLLSSEVYYEKLIKLDSLNGHYLKQLGQIKVKNGDIIGAFLAFSKSIHLLPKDIEIYISLAEVLEATEAAEEADSLLRAGLRIDSLNYNLKMMLARSSFNRKKYDQAVSVIEGILEKRDTLAAHANLLGSSYFALKEYEKVITCMNFLVNEKKDADWVHFYLGVSYRETGQHEKAVKHLKLAVEKGISKNMGSYYTNLGIAYESTNDLKNAIWAFEKAAEFKTTKLLLFRLANCYDQQQENRAKALKYYKAYLSTGDTASLLVTTSKRRIEALENTSVKDSIADRSILTDSIFMENEEIGK